MLYKIKYFEDKEAPHQSGWYLIKRKWLWWLLLPILIIPKLLKCIWEYTTRIYSFPSHWIAAPKTKLTKIEREVIYKKLKY